jgi:hypothetical protein
MRIIYPQDTGVLGVIIPAPKFMDSLADMTEIEKLRHVADKALDTGIKYEIVEDDYVPSDRSFRNAWEYVAGADEQVSEDLSLDDQLKYNHITQEQFDATNG